jgi:hypothetical protein
VPKSSKESDFIATARKRFEQAASDEKLLREEALIDLKYVAGDQWDPRLKQQREQAGRPALTFPRCHTFVQQVSNEARQNKPQIKFAPGDEQADKDTADVLEGMARAIQYESDAQIAYETSVEYSAGGSFGFYRILPSKNDDGMQDLKILPVLDPFAVYGILFPYCFGREPRFGFVVEDMPRDEFESLYPDSEITKGGIGGSDTSWMSGQGWLGTETVRVAEYWYCEGKGRDTVVKFCKMSGMEVLPGTDGEESKTQWLGYCIPVFPVTGKIMILQGRPVISSVVRPQRGAQQMINYGKTRIAETLATAPISPFMVARGQIDKGDKKWENLNTQVFPYLEYNAVDVMGRPAPPPQRQTFEPPIAALSSFVEQEIDDMKAVSGIFDASMGARSNETSGQAIARRQQQANMTTMHYMDNLERSFKKAGNALCDAIPKYYDEERMVMTLGPDEKPKIVKVNALHQDEGGKERHYKVGGDDAGKYHVIVTMGRAFSTKRQETFDLMQQLVQSAPNLLPMFGDVMFQNSDAAGADIVADRFKKMLPPQLQDQSDDPAAQLNQIQAQAAQLQQQNQALNAYAQQLEKEKEGKVIETQGRTQIAQMQEMSKQEIVKMQEATKIAVAQINASKDANEAIAQRELEQFKILHGGAHDIALQKDDQAHAEKLAQQQQIAAQQQQAQQAQDQSQQSAQEAEQGLAAQQQQHAQTLEQQQAAADNQPAAGEQQ